MKLFMFGQLTSLFFYVFMLTFGGNAFAQLPMLLSKATNGL
jgi:hypothetical protein